jgi:hypothetical protein
LLFIKPSIVGGAVSLVLYVVGSSLYYIKTKFARLDVPTVIPFVSSVRVVAANVVVE